MIESLARRMDIHRERYRLAGFVGNPATNMLKALLSNIDLRFLLKCDSDLERYQKYAAYQADAFMSFYDPEGSGKLNFNTLVDNSSRRCLEYWVTCHRRSPLERLPLEGGWSSWSNVRAFWLMVHDSSELPKNLLSHDLVFLRDLPSYIVVGIDPEALVLKWCNYAMSYDDAEAMERFIHLEMGALHDDLLRIWAVNHLTLWLRDLRPAQRDDPYDMRGIVDFDETVVGGTFTNAAGCLREAVRGIAHDSPTFEMLLSAPWVFGLSIFDLVDEQLMDRRVSPHIQYAYLKFVVEFPLLRLLLTLNWYRPGDLPDKTNFKRLMRRALQHLRLAGLAQHAKQPILKEALLRQTQTIDTLTS